MRLRTQFIKAVTFSPPVHMKGIVSWKYLKKSQRYAVTGRRKR
jgi:hypothetical protein